VYVIKNLTIIAILKGICGPTLQKNLSYAMYAIKDLKKTAP
jgi:hypothetical protein